MHGEDPGIRKSKTNPKVQGHGARPRTDGSRNLMLDEKKLKKIVASGEDFDE